ncbi:putative Sulfotransferase 1C2 [Hypsibius exemplaris]|uniref:Sulfotransferase 1C2 n=1 Tax=Hypsibius exemplaris TaxID=2072580 RepID=A0A1W0WHJ2_HYPEX|nr:putative Sulfotransferase 1C2 [Hypsibius exemplaris]
MPTIASTSSQAVQYPSIGKPPFKIGYHHPDFLKDFKGYKIRFPQSLTLDEVAKFEARASDVVVCSLPKAGTNWTNAIVLGVRENGNAQVYRDGVVLSEKSKCIEHCDPDDPVEKWPIQSVKKQTSDRQYFTHLAYECMPESINASGAKKVFVYRNPKDMAISQYYYIKQQPRIQFQGDLNDIVDSFIDDTLPFGPYFDHLASFWKKRHEDPNIIFFSFEDLKKDFKGTVKRLGHFLGKDLTAEQIDAIYKETDFKTAQANPLLNRSEYHAKGVLDLNMHPFIRDGSIGQWKTTFTPEMNAKMDAWIERNMKRPELQGIHLQME